jgi:hypothetical protein
VEQLRSIADELPRTTQIALKYYDDLLKRIPRQVPRTTDMDWLQIGVQLSQQQII